MDFGVVDNEPEGLGAVDDFEMIDYDDEVAVDNAPPVNDEEADEIEAEAIELEVEMAARRRPARGGDGDRGDGGGGGGGGEGGGLFMARPDSPYFELPNMRDELEMFGQAAMRLAFTTFCFILLTYETMVRDPKPFMKVLVRFMVSTFLLPLNWFFYNCFLVVLVFLLILAAIIMIDRHIRSR